MAPLPRYEGTFSFVSSRLYASIKRAIPTYDKEDPKTWPYVTLSTIEKLRPYQGFPDLPTGVAYQREAMKRYEDMYTPQERATAASVNGPLHQRYPYNYDRFDEPKEKVGMSGAEYRSYVANTTPMPSTPRVHEREEWEQDIPDSAIDCSTPSAGRMPCLSPTPATRTQPPSHCTNKTCTDTRREAARLRGTLFDKDSQLLSCQSDLKEYETTEKLRRRALEDAEYEVEKERQRADAAERECMLRMEGNIRLQQRVRELEGRVKQAQDLDGYCVELEGEIERLNGVREGEGEESDDCDDRLRKRMRSESL
ncbi:uncharacterized protein J4E79_007143 [Alternaria viburni]|uniref:uncharacterized protein n=1 Tax=Alternaria viburni TaxID=566460 RepID=UPI0020C2EC99|nr:uncharacterized protein J4E79_007143 [Alternaria viburni]KAI4658161.1 hypothetical protein J4E79_007143 [Alternaria viburni]